MGNYIMIAGVVAMLCGILVMMAGFAAFLALVIDIWE
jgi:hypothetical protein